MQTLMNMGVGIKKNPNIKWMEGNDEKLLMNIKGMNLIMALET